jgi:hypothetical protein
VAQGVPLDFSAKPYKDVLTYGLFSQQMVGEPLPMAACV